MRLRGRVDVAKDICKDHNIKTRTPLAIVMGDPKLYCHYKVRLYTMELNRLQGLFKSHPDPEVQMEMEYFIKCTEGLCDVCIDRGVKVDDLYDLIEECYVVIKPTK